ncbi:MAG: IMPACT family protein [Anaerolineae bacterium]
MRRYPVPAGTARIEFVEKGSRFIATAGPAHSIEEAMAFISKVKAEFHDATHNVWAYVVGYGPTSRYACHNDGEPGGTAGPPALSVLQNAGLGDVVVVVTRYFGGVKLGTGGLVRAYSNAARLAVEALPRAEKVDQVALAVRVPYRFYQAVLRQAESFQTVLLHTEHEAEVVFHLLVPEDRCEEFRAAVRESTAGEAAFI